ncbi:hypothetical protein G6549_15195 [Bacillus sp. MM2020_1]|nr:hypothetical protein [Bacillus sp. MM2020_1]
MFNEYSVFQMMKLREEETERNAKEAWKHYVQQVEEKYLKNLKLQSPPSLNPCCHCACA